VLPAVLAVGAIAAVVLLLIGIFGQNPSPGSDALPARTTATTTTPPTTTSATTPATTTPPTTSVTVLPTTPTIPTTTVIVLNSTETSGLASRVSAYLGSLGWHVAGPDNYFPLLDKTTVYYPEGQEAAAELLAAAAPGDANTIAPVIPAVPADALTVVLGADAADWVAPVGTPTTP
jgi:hypothetical protein